MGERGVAVRARAAELSRGGAAVGRAAELSRGGAAGGRAAEASRGAAASAPAAEAGVELLVILDGASEPPRPGLPTSLERAATPALDRLCAEGALTRLQTVAPWLDAGSEHAIPALLGWTPPAPVDRGAVEAAARGIAAGEGERAWRIDVRASADGGRADAARALPALAAALPSHRVLLLGGHRLLAVGRAPLPTVPALDGLTLHPWPEGLVPPRLLDASTVVVAAPGAAAGIARLLGARVVTPRGATGRPGSDLAAKAAAALAVLAGVAAFGDAAAPGEAAALGEAAAFGDAAVFGDVAAFGDAAALGDAAAFGDAAVFGDAAAPGEAAALGDAAQPGETERIARIVVHVGAPDEAAHELDAAAKIAAIEAADRDLIAPLAAALRARGAGTLRVCPDHGCDPRDGRHDPAPVPCVTWSAQSAPQSASAAPRLTERAVAGLPALAPPPAPHATTSARRRAA